MKVSNCWDFLKCGRENECLAYPRQGRNCFAVTGKQCRGQEQGTNRNKIDTCRTQCAFYKAVMFDE